MAIVLSVGVLLVISLAISPAQSPIKPLVANRPWQFVIYIKAPTSPRPPPISHLNTKPHRAKTRNGGKHRGGLSQHSDCEPRFHEPHESDSHTSRIPEAQKRYQTQANWGPEKPPNWTADIEVGLIQAKLHPKNTITGSISPKNGP